MYPMREEKGMKKGEHMRKKRYMDEKIKTFFLSANKYIKEKIEKDFDFYISPSTIAVTKEINLSYNSLKVDSTKEKADYTKISKRTNQILSDSVQEFSFSNLPQKLNFFLSKIDNLKELYVPGNSSFSVEIFDRNSHIETIELSESKLSKNKHLKEIDKWLTEEEMAISFVSSIFFIPILHEHRRLIESLLVLIEVSYEVSSFI